jgi:O-antigen ligase
MKEIFYIDDTLTNKISYYLLLAFLVALPFDMFYSEMLLVCLLIHTLIQLKKGQPVRFRPSLLLVVGIYLLTMAGTLYSSDQHQAWKDWEKQLALLLFPLIFSINGLDLQKYKLPLFKAFGLSCLITVIWLYIYAWRTMRFNGLGPRSLFSAPFMNHNFTMPIDLHATYFSMYIAISLITFTYLLLRSRRRSWGRLLNGLAILILLASLLQLASRAVWVAVMVMMVTLPFFLMERRPARRFILVAIPLAACFLFAMIKVSTFTDRYIVDLKVDLSASAEDPGILEPRIVRWKCAWELIRASPWIGYGTGAEVSVLKERYYDRRLYSSYVHELNAHNEYLSFLLKTGLLGLLVYLALLATGFRQAIRSRDAFFYGFLVIAFCVCFSENILDTNKGIFFFGFFFSIFFVTSSPGRPGKPGTAGDAVDALVPGAPGVTLA